MYHTLVVAEVVVDQMVELEVQVVQVVAELQAQEVIKQDPQDLLTLVVEVEVLLVVEVLQLEAQVVQVLLL
jgi:hypothetical protein